MQKGDTDLTLVQKIVDTLGQQPDISLECSGAEICVRTAIQATECGGVALIVGMGKPELMLPLGSALIREVDIRGVIRYNNE